MIFKRNDIHLAFLIVFSMIALIWLYTKNKYFLFSDTLSNVEIVVNQNIDKNALPIMYLTSGSESKINFDEVYVFSKLSDSTYISRIDKDKVRNLRLYFNNPGQTLTLYGLKISSKSEIRHINLSTIKNKEKLSYKEKVNGYDIEVFEPQSYIELPQEMAYTSDVAKLHHYALPLILILICSFFILRTININQIEINSFSDTLLALLILSIFCPPPIYNIALILITLMNLRKLHNFNVKKYKMSLVVIAFFAVYLLNNLFISSDSYNEMSTIERFLPFLILSLIVPLVNNRKLLIFFPISALVLGFGFLTTSIIDAMIYKNQVFLSFDFFAKYIHPIYFSYLLFFSICYVHLNVTGLKKYFLIATLFVFMIFSGSKMVLMFTLIAMFINIVSINKTGLLVIPLLLVLVLFSPLKNRFNEILHIEDTSILKEQHIDNPYDARINGLTLRLILWREALATMDGFDYLIGKGVTDAAEDELSHRIDALGLTKHVNFNPHNQYVDTFWRTGILGLAFLLLIPIYGIHYGIKRKDVLLIQFSIFMMVIMFSESIFGRVNGIYFFTIVLLMLTNPRTTNEDSHIRD